MSFCVLEALGYLSSLYCNIYAFYTLWPLKLSILQRTLKTADADVRHYTTRNVESKFNKGWQTSLWIISKTFKSGWHGCIAVWKTPKLKPKNEAPSSLKNERGQHYLSKEEYSIKLHQISWARYMYKGMAVGTGSKQCREHFLVKKVFRLLKYF